MDEEKIYYRNFQFSVFSLLLLLLWDAVSLRDGGQKKAQEEEDGKDDADDDAEQKRAEINDSIYAGIYLFV